MHLAKGDELRRDEKVIRHADGTSTAKQLCGYARYEADGSRLFGDEQGIDHPNVDGYVGQTFNWAFAGALEVYGVVQCSDFPTSTAYQGGNTISMNSLILFNRGLAQVAHPVWKVSETTPGLKPNCHYGASIAKQIILNN